MCVCFTQGLEPASIRDRLSDWDFKTPRIVLPMPKGMAPEQQPVALTAALQQLRSMRAALTSAAGAGPPSWPQRPPARYQASTTCALVCALKHSQTSCWVWPS